MQRPSTVETMPAGRDAQRAVIDRARESLETIILGKQKQISLALAKRSLPRSPSAVVAKLVRTRTPSFVSSASNRT